MMESRKRRIDTLQTVELADGMEIHLRVAGPFLRLSAFLLDLISKYAVMVALQSLLELIFPFLGGNVAIAFSYLAAFFVWWFYDVVFELSPWGATLGKKAFGLRVVNEAGGGVKVGQAMIRNIIKTIEIFVPFLPLIACFHPRFQRLGDLAAGTLVIYSRPRIDPMVPGPPPMHCVPVNLALSREEEAAILSYRYRSGGWSEARRVELADHLKKITGETGPRGINRVMGMAQWLEERR